jgi:acetyl-CoA carboxylase biotin carboxylase subunit
MGIQTVAVYSTADRESLHVRFADEAVCIGPPPSKDSYLNIPAIISAAELTASEAIHPGYGFLSENARFSEICATEGIKFIGPGPEVIAKMGDKATAKETMRAAGVPVIPGSDGVIETLAQAKKIAKQIGYPVIIKATAGGGGKGMRVLKNEDDLNNLWDAARNEARAAFGNDGMYMEKFILRPRHVEIQVFGDQFGQATHLSERDCSIQRRHQKLVEESPCPVLSSEVRQRMGEAAIRGCKAVNYEGAGTIEFLLDEDGSFYFMEMNTRIQVEHPVTEQIFGFDLIKEQILVAAGVPISGHIYLPPANRFAMECRINAEDPDHDFRPSPGRIQALFFPGGPGVRFDSHVYAGYQIPPNYDSMIGKLIVTAMSREEVLDKMARALDELVLEGIKTTIPFHRKLMQNPRFRAGDVHTKYLEEWDFKKA